MSVLKGQAVDGTFQVSSCSDLVIGGFVLLKLKLLELLELLELSELLMFPLLQDLQHI